MTQTTKMSQLAKTSELFADLPDSIREEIVSIARPTDYMCGQVMFLEGDPITETFLLLEGRAKTMLLSRKGAEVILEINNPGELIGRPGLGLGSTHHSTAEAVQDSRVLVWRAEVFEAAAGRFPILRRNVVGILQRRIHEMEQRLCEGSTQLASPRLAHSLTRLADQIGNKVNSRVEIHISQEDLGRMTAMTLSTVNRLLSSWENQGVLRVRRQRIEIWNPLQLTALCRVD
jgi:CRP-like cAMP-binding protein